MRATLILLGSLFFSATALAESTVFKFEFEEIAEGVWAGVRPDGPRFPVMGNTLFVLSDEGVVVYDGGGVAAMAEQIIAKIRSLTDKPVTHVVISHWHGDHNFGVYRFSEEYPGVRIVAHRFTAEVIDSPRIAYIDKTATYIERNRANMETIVNTGLTNDGRQVSDFDRKEYARTLRDADLIEHEYQRIRVIRPNLVMDDKLTIESGERTIELLHLGHANTAGDIVLWLPQEKIVATGDVVVLPSPYAYNVPPRAWAATLGNINKLGYDILVPGHGALQRDNNYVDLIIEAAESVAAQRDALIGDGMQAEDVEAALDLTPFEERFTDGDEYVATYYRAYFERPFKKAALKALTGEPMVAIDKAEVVSFDDSRWEVTAANSERLQHLGRDALMLQGGTALLSDLDALNAIVEFDIAVGPERGFAGLMFRVEDAENYEHFYIRPHQSGNPDANQYTPVFNGVSAWQLYHGAEYASPVVYSYDSWMHVKIVYAGTRADVYIDSDVPALRVRNLMRGEKSGAIGINASSFARAYFSNLKVSPLANAFVLPTNSTSGPASANSTVKNWSVSQPFEHTVLDGITALSANHRDAQSWSDVETDETGILNLASVPINTAKANTRFARLKIDATSGQKRQLKFGYSDSAKVFLNGELLYSGDNTYQSRDYRYLGTIGLFDTVSLPLRPGENEVLIAVTEAFGGWGVIAELGSP